MNRWFTRCARCLVIVAIDNERPAHGAICGLCDGAIEVMGRVERDRLIDEHLACKCDDRCTSARGPLCTCKCAGKNHGAGLIGGYSVVKTDKGPVPTVTPRANLEQARINAREYAAAIDAATAQWRTYTDAKRRGEYLSRHEFDRMRALELTLHKARVSRLHPHRMRLLRAVLPAPVVLEIAQAIADAPKVADAPFALRATPAPMLHPKQTALF